MSIILALAVFLFLNSTDEQATREVMEIEDNGIASQLKKENEELQRVLTSILPKEQKIMYENTYRLDDDRYFSAKTLSLLDVLDKGKTINFTKPYSDNHYKRPMYDSSWRDFYFRHWLYLPDKITDAHHRMFIFPFGGSSIFDFIGQQGISPLSVDYHSHINLLIYNFQVEAIKHYDNQVALIGKPRREGLQVITMIQDDLLDEGVSKKDLLFQLATPKGYEIDYIVGQVRNYNDMMEEIKKNTVSQTCIHVSIHKTIEELEQDNMDLKKDLSYYIPMDQQVVITNQNCRPPIDNMPSKSLDMASVKAQGTPIEYGIMYQNTAFKRPIYDPIWKTTIQQNGTLVPYQICQNMHNLFVLPTNPEEQILYLQSLSIHDKINLDASKDRYILLFNFQPEQILQYEQQIIILGTPTRKGAYILSLHQDNLSSHKEYMIQLVTPDLMEVDYILLK
ncbi:hypothetical protein HZI73_20220 [Vallitalea pronyensis]|uniref:Uncharacterized protein n=1 Tax=Vallitalea pronyensis TaxID=1348613 RepID=A0A8J8MNJ3_9FIRM|nr:hypothetical protein [Vallitalea pronyensis]QUI24483.1 hypothetical protein HZI73_20220 [Vallitalea pronyensis]